MRLSPQQILYAKLLQLPAMQLEQRIKQELEENPLLEDLTEIDDLQTADAAANDDEPVVNPEIPDAPAGSLNEPEPEASATSAPELSAAPNSPDPPAAATETSAPPAEPAPEPTKTTESDDFEREISEYLDDDLEGYKTSNFNLKSDDDDREFQQAYEESFSEKLTEQLHLLSLTDKAMLIAEELIGNLEDDGYLRCPLDSIADGLLTMGVTASEKEIEDVLEKIWYLDPVGIGARNLQECLLIQLRVFCRETDDDQVDRDAHVAMKIIGQYYTDFTMMHYEKLLESLSIAATQLKRAIGIIQRLNPKPGGGNARSDTRYITPDFTVTFNGTELVASTSDRNAPQIRISNAYRHILEDKKQPKETREFLKNKLDSAKGFVTAIEMRRQTMQKVMKAILKLQYEFFTEGKHKLKPMILKDVAEETNLDISTISRVANGKYVQTDNGTYELKYFFTASMETESGDEVSNRVIKQFIKDYIEREEAGKPLSDDKLAEMLSENGYKVARRTVAKYREQLSIPVARLRRKIETL